MATITIPKDHFDTLLRRAELHKPSDDTIIISKVEHDALLKSAREYTSLKAALINGGVSIENLKHLISIFPADHAYIDASHGAFLQNQNSKTSWSAEPPPFLPSNSLRPTEGVNNLEARAVAANQHLVDWQSPSVTPDSYEYDDEKSSMTSSEKSPSAEVYDEKNATHVGNNCDRRSIIMRGLSDLTTLADIAKVVKGGQVLNFFILTRERVAHIAFVHASDAEAYVLYARRVGIYILGKRIEVVWDAEDHQYFLPGHLYHRIREHGASRNLVIRFPKADMTDESIRADLEHIYRLRVVSLTIDHGSIFISLNSVQLAINARSCMSSRLKYKGSRVEFHPDECAEPLPQIAKRLPIKQMPPPARQDFHNRFQMLAFDGVFEDEEDDEILRLNRFEGIGRGDWTGQTLPG